MYIRQTQHAVMQIRQEKLCCKQGAWQLMAMAISMADVKTRNACHGSRKLGGAPMCSEAFGMLTTHGLAD